MSLKSTKREKKFLQCPKNSMKCKTWIIMNNFIIYKLNITVTVKKMQVLIHLQVIMLINILLVR